GSHREVSGCCDKVRRAVAGLRQQDEQRSEHLRARRGRRSRGYRTGRGHAMNSDDGIVGGIADVVGSSTRSVTNAVLQSGDYSESDQIVDDAKPALWLFEDFHPYFQRASKLIDDAGMSPGGGPGMGSTPGGMSPGGGPGMGSTPGGMSPGGGPQLGGGMPGGGYRHSGVDPQSLRAGMDEFRGIDFASFRQDAQTLKEIQSTVEDSAGALNDSWGKAAADWTGAAKDAAQQRKNNLTEGSGDLSQALKT